MTDNQIRIAVAEACGWERLQFEGETRPAWVKKGHKTQGWEQHWFEELPDYPNDLNACAEFEATLTDEEHKRYRAYIYGVNFNPRKSFSADAKTRCLAFLKTKGILP